MPYVLKNLYKKGFIFLDEYYSLKFPGPKIAIDEFCKEFKTKVKKLPTRIGEFERYFISK
ncbi:hypothetical protein [Candidatus Pelagibacter sp. HIMB1715]|uniref:hypothetical protein n=1 Tax=Candidatus Pelagibacter sp. HIMB1715 TaxID=3413369 RepID=UPI003F844D3D